MTRADEGDSWIGKSVRRIEDPKFLLGRGRYIDDLELPHMLHAAVLRSPHAHARIRGIDTSAAREVRGVVDIITGEQAAEICGPLPDLGPHPDKHVWRCLAADKVRYAGEGVAAVVARSRAEAEDGCAAIEVDYDPLPSVTDMEDAPQASSAQVHEALGGNLLFARQLSWGNVDDVMARADLVVRDRLRWHRSGAQPLETAGCIADFDPATQRMRIYENSLTFSNFLFMLAATLGVESHKLEVIPSPAGGSFGSKTWAVKVAGLAGMLSKHCGRPVKFIEDRRDNLGNCDHHGSDRLYEAELAVSSQGELQGFRVSVTDDYGAYAQFGVGTHANALSQVVGPYRIDHVAYDLKAVLTNKCQQGACRGFGSEVHNWVLERMVDLAASRLDMDRLDIRRRNFIPEEDFPHKIPFGNEYDSGNYAAVLDRALSMIDLSAWQKRKDEAPGRDARIGIGFCTANERSVFAGTELGLLFDPPARVTSMPESVNVAVDAMGKITATLFSGAFTGNSAETMVAQFLAEELCVTPQHIDVRYAGFHSGYPGTGPAGSRFTVMIAGAIRGACDQLREKACHIGAELLGCRREQVLWSRGSVVRKGDSTETRSLAEIATTAHLFKHSLAEDISTGLQASFVFDHPHMSVPKGDGKDLGIFFPFVGHGCHIAVVEVDPELGSVQVLDYVAVHDNGTVVNPRSLEGQIRGGTAHGIGSALMEEYVYGDDGEFVTNNYHQYLIPTAMEIPPMRVAHVETPSPFTPHGIKGGGEAGRLMAPAAISSAIDDALSDFGVRVNELPATPERIVGWIQGDEKR